MVITKKLAKVKVISTKQKASFFDCLMDMAGHLGGSRAGSLSLEGAPLMGGQEHSDTHLALPEDSSLISLARRSTKRNRSLRYVSNLNFFFQ